MKLYRLQTEDVNRKEIEKLVSSYFSAFTVITAKGYWKGLEEKSLIVEVYSLTDATGDTFVKLAREIKTLNKQDAVLVSVVPVDNAELI